MGKYNVTQYIDVLAAQPGWDTDAATVAVNQIFGTLITATLKYFNIYETKEDSSRRKEESDPFEDLTQTLKIYDLVFVYFFVTAGLTLIMMAILIALAKKGKCAGDYAAIVLRLVVGCGLAMISLVELNLAAKQNFLYSAWMLPSVCMGLFVVVLLDGVFGWVMPAPRPMVSRKNSREVGNGPGNA